VDGTNNGSDGNGGNSHSATISPLAIINPSNVGSPKTRNGSPKHASPKHLSPKHGSPKNANGKKKKQNSTHLLRLPRHAPKLQPLTQVSLVPLADNVMSHEACTAGGAMLLGKDAQMPKLNFPRVENRNVGLMSGGLLGGTGGNAIENTTTVTSATTATKSASRGAPNTTTTTTATATFTKSNTNAHVNSINNANETASHSPTYTGGCLNPNEKRIVSVTQLVGAREGGEITASPVQGTPSLADLAALETKANAYKSPTVAQTAL
jgi:hypothetical protein